MQVLGHYSDLEKSSMRVNIFRVAAREYMATRIWLSLLVNFFYLQTIYQTLLFPYYPNLLTTTLTSAILATKNAFSFRLCIYGWT